MVAQYKEKPRREAGARDQLLMNDD